MRASRDVVRGRASTLGMLTAVVAAGVLLGGTGVVLLRTASEVVAPAAAEAAGPKAGKKTKAAARFAGSVARQAARGAAAAPVAAQPGTREVAAAPGKPAVVAPVTQLDDQITYQYNTLGRRDPFNPLMGGAFVGADVGGDAPVEVGGMSVVGIVWGAEDKFALVEDARGNSVILRQGDKVMNGHVESLKRDAVIVSLETDGQQQSVAIPLTKKGDSNANR